MKNMLGETSPGLLTAGKLRRLDEMLYDLRFSGNRRQLNH